LEAASGHTATALDPSDSVVLPGYGRLDAMASYVFGRARREEKPFKLSVNLQNVANRRYFETGNTTNVIFPGSPVNVWSRFEVRF